MRVRRGIVPPVTFFVVSVIALVLMMLATGSLVTPSTKSNWLLSYLNWLLSYLKETVRTLAWKRLFLFAIPFLAVFTVLAASISMISGWVAKPVGYEITLAISCYFGGTSYLCFSAAILLAVPQWANAADRRFRPRWLWAAVLGGAMTVAFLRCMYSFLLLLHHFLDGAIYQTILVYGLGFVLMNLVLGFVTLWGLPFIDRSTANTADD